MTDTIALTSEARLIAGRSARRRSDGFAGIAIATATLAAVMSALWPGAITWFWDEPVLVAQAYFFNQDHTLAPRGMGGNFGIPYGPLATQMYQFMLLFTHDPRVMVVWHALLFSTLLSIAVLWLSRTLELSVWFGIAILFSPYVSWIERDLWDATCAIPLGALAMAAYADFLRTRRNTSLAIALAGATLTPFVHMQGLPLFFAIVGHAGLRHWRSIFRGAGPIALALAPVAIINYRYVRIFREFFRHQWPDMIHQGYHDRHDLYLTSLLGPFTSGGLNFVGDNWVVTAIGLPGPAWLGPAMIFLSYIAMGLIWLGMLVAVVHVARRFLHRPPARSAAIAFPTATAARDQIMLLCLAVLAMQLSLAAALRLPNYPQYSYGTWPIHLLFAWFGVESLRRLRLMHPVTALYGLTAIYLTLGGNYSVHRNGWVRDMNCPTLEDQIPIAQQLNHYNNPIVYTDVPIFKSFPRAIEVLRLLFPPTEHLPASAARHRLHLRYQQNGNPRTQRIELVDLGDSPAPPGAEEIDVTPAKRWY